MPPKSPCNAPVLYVHFLLNGSPLDHEILLVSLHGARTPCLFLLQKTNMTTPLESKKNFPKSFFQIAFLFYSLRV